MLSWLYLKEAAVVHVVVRFDNLECFLVDLHQMIIHSHQLQIFVKSKLSLDIFIDKLCDYTVQNLVVGSSNSDDGTYKTDKERMSASLIQFHSSDFFM